MSLHGVFTAAHGVSTELAGVGQHRHPKTFKKYLYPKPLKTGIRSSPHPTSGVPQKGVGAWGMPPKTSKNHQAYSTPCARSHWLIPLPCRYYYRDIRFSLMKKFRLWTMSCRTGLHHDRSCREAILPLTSFCIDRVLMSTEQIPKCCLNLQNLETSFIPFQFHKTCATSQHLR